jgi:hypothetical protein
MFAGLPQGAEFTAGGELFAINYHGGDGHDVVLTALGAASIWDVGAAASAQAAHLHLAHSDFLFA